MAVATNPPTKKSDHVSMHLLKDFMLALIVNPSMKCLPNLREKTCRALLLSYGEIRPPNKAQRLQGERNFKKAPEGLLSENQSPTPPSFSPAPLGSGFNKSARPLGWKI